MFLPSIDRGETVTLDKAPEVKMATPIVGGSNDGVPWTGGSNLDEKKNEAPIDVL